MDPARGNHVLTPQQAAAILKVDPSRLSGNGSGSGGSASGQPRLDQQQHPQGSQYQLPSDQGAYPPSQQMHHPQQQPYQHTSQSARGSSSHDVYASHFYPPQNAHEAPPPPPNHYYTSRPPPPSHVPPPPHHGYRPPPPSGYYASAPYHGYQGYPPPPQYGYPTYDRPPPPQAHYGNYPDGYYAPPPPQAYYGPLPPNQHRYPAPYPPYPESAPPPAPTVGPHPGLPSNQHKYSPHQQSYVVTESAHPGPHEPQSDYETLHMRAPPKLASAMTTVLASAARPAETRAHLTAIAADVLALRAGGTKRRARSLSSEEGYTEGGEESESPVEDEDDEEYGSRSRRFACVVKGCGRKFATGKGLKAHVVKVHGSASARVSSRGSRSGSRNGSRNGSRSRGSSQQPPPGTGPGSGSSHRGQNGTNGGRQGGYSSQEDKKKDRDHASNNDGNSQDGGSREQDVSEFLLNEPQQHGAEPDRSQQENETNALPAETRESGESIELAAPLPSPLPQRDSAKSLRHSLSENATFIYGHVTPHYSGYDEPFYGPSASYGADPRHHAYAPHRCDYTIDSCADPYYAAHYYSYAESHPALRYAHDHPPENVFHKYLADEHSKEEYSTEEYATNALAEPAVQDLYDPFASSYSDEVATNSESTLDRATTPVRGMQLPTPVDDKVAASGKPIVSFAAGMYRCNVDGCRKTYTSSSSLQYHLHHGHRIQKRGEGEERTRYECLDPRCQKTYTSVAGLKYHMKHGHDEMEGAFGGSTSIQKSVGLFHCTVPGCAKIYTSMPGLKYHNKHNHLDEKEVVVG